MLPVIDPGGQRTGRQIVLNCLALLPVSLLPTLIGMAGSLYFWGAIALGVLYLGAGLLVAARPSEDTARTLLRVSVGYLPLLVILMATDRVTF
jgi:protoheme IX farnesyltransferase